ncbi:oligosaccharide flippase family protein [Empedobacter stercoris]|uniref:oligosaccharide flippase family protein n=1 Tax=Empedobacter stercoris TaxID=1628248 RepID=UPI0039EAE243
MFKKKLKNSNNLKSLIINFISLALINAVNFVVPIFIIPFLVKKVGVENYGKYAFVFAFIFYFLYISQFGFSLTAVRDIAKNKNDLEKVNSIYNNVLNTKFFVLFVCFIILLTLVFSIDKLYEEKFLVLTTFLIVVGDVIGPTWLFQGMEKMKFVTIINVLAKLTYIILVLVFIKIPSDYLYIGLLQSIGFLVSGVITIYLAHKQFNIKYRLSSINEIINQLKYSFSSFITLIIPLLYVNTSSVIMGFLGQDKHVAYFDTSYKVSNGFVSINQILTNALYPFVSRKENMIKLASILLISVGAFMTILSFLLSEFIIINIMNLDMKESILPLKILCLSPLFLSIRSAFGVNYLLVKNHDKLYMKIAMFSSIFSFIIGFMIIQKWYSVGAAVVVVLAQGLYSLISMFFALKFMRNER